MLSCLADPPRTKHRATVLVHLCKVVTVSNLWTQEILSDPHQTTEMMSDNYHTTRKISADCLTSGPALSTIEIQVKNHAQWRNFGLKSGASSLRFTYKVYRVWVGYVLPLQKLQSPDPRLPLKLLCLWPRPYQGRKSTRKIPNWLETSAEGSSETTKWSELSNLDETYRDIRIH